jgi:hypothetical protein
MAAVRSRRAAERSKKQRRIIVVAVAAVAGLAALILPSRLAHGSLDAANADKAKMESDVLALQPAVKLSDQLKAIKAAQLSATATEPAWNVVVKKILSSAPKDAAVQYTSFSMQSDGKSISVQYAVSMTQVPNFDPVAAWLDNLYALGATSAFTPSINKQASVTDATVQIVTSFTASFPLSGDFLSERAAVVPTTAPATTTTTPAAGG